MNPYIEQVKLFMQKFKHKMYEQQTVNDLGTNVLRVNLIEEELKELRQGIVKQNKLEVLDALCDLQYVLSGAVIALGFADVFDDAFAEVQRSNMSKACQTENEAIDSVKHYFELNQACYMERQVDNTFHIIRESDGKLLKAINYSPAQLEQFIK